MKYLIALAASLCIFQAYASRSVTPLTRITLNLSTFEKEGFTATKAPYYDYIRGNPTHAIFDVSGDNLIVAGDNALLLQRLDSKTKTFAEHFIFSYKDILKVSDIYVLNVSFVTPEKILIMYETHAHSTYVKMLALQNNTITGLQLAQLHGDQKYSEYLFYSIQVIKQTIFLTPIGPDTPHPWSSEHPYYALDMDGKYLDQSPSNMIKMAVNAQGTYFLSNDHADQFFAFDFTAKKFNEIPIPPGHIQYGYRMGTTGVFTSTRFIENSSSHDSDTGKNTTWIEFKDYSGYSGHTVQSLAIPGDVTLNYFTFGNRAVIYKSTPPFQVFEKVLTDDSPFFENLKLKEKLATSAQYADAIRISGDGLKLHGKNKDLIYFPLQNKIIESGGLRSIVAPFFIASTGNYLFAYTLSTLNICDIYDRNGNYIKYTEQSSWDDERWTPKINDHYIVNYGYGFFQGEDTNYMNVRFLD